MVLQQIFSALVPDSIRYPPSANVPIGLVNAPKLKEKLSSDNAALTPNSRKFYANVSTDGRRSTKYVTR